MIDRISKSNQLNNIHIDNRKKDNNNKTNPNFQGRLLNATFDATLKGIQKCEKNPMLNVAIIDLATAIIPRSVFESFTNIFAGFEAFRRESSGLIVNCLLPGFIALGAGKVVNKLIMGDKANLSSCWAGSDGIDTISNYYTNAEGTKAYEEGLSKFNDKKKAKVYATHYNMLSEASGIDGEVKKTFGEVKNLNISEAAEMLTEATFEKPKNLTFKEKLASIKNIFKEKPKSLIDRAFETVSSKTHITENIKFGSGENSVTTGLKSAMKNTTEMMRGFLADGVENKEQVAKFAKKAKKLVNVKSGIAMAIIIPIAASMQSINRWITSKMSGVKGAPIYNDYTEKKEKIVKTPEQAKADKAALLKQKFISVGSMVGVALLSIMKIPNKTMLRNIVQFKGQFPTMDQARVISTVTFGSRMAVADDKNELAEATTRDIVTFGSMYFLGDYAAKGYASYLENKDGVKLLNKSKKVDKNAGFFKKFGNWVVNTHLKSTDELTADGTRSLEKMKHLRAKCQAVNLGSALLILGLLVPVYTRFKTKKNHTKDLIAQKELNSNKTKSKENVTISKNHGNSDFSGVFKNLRTGVEGNMTFQAFKQIAKESK